ncbi:MAG: Gfo/Idh/MocA family protein [Candidatus Methylomirabilia bacterium]
MRVLLVGLGRWGERHLRVLTELGVEVWVADLSFSRLTWATETFGIDPARTATAVRSVLDRVDAVDLVTPADTHLPLAVRCLEAGKDCFVEKPLTRTVAEARALAKVVKTTGRLLQVGHVFRFHPVTDVLRRWLAEGRVGAVRYLTGRFAGFKRPRTDVGATQTDAIHYVDLFGHLLGRSPTAVTATLRDYLGRGMDDLAFVTVEYGETPAFIEAGYFAPDTARECVVVGEGGSLVADFAQWVVSAFDNQHQVRDSRWEARVGEQESLKAEGEEPLRRELACFLDAVGTRQAPPVGVGDGLLALQVVEAAHRSSRLGCRVGLEEPELS